MLIVTPLTNIVKHRQTRLTCLPVPQLEQLVPPPEPEVGEVVEAEDHGPAPVSPLYIVQPGALQRVIAIQDEEQYID